MLMAKIIDPVSPAGLKPLSERLIDGKAARMQTQLDEEMSRNGWSWGTVPIEFQPYWAYGALDTVLTTRLFHLFYDKCGPERVYHKAYELEMATRRIATRMELNGAKVDVEYSKKKYEELIDYTERTKSWAYNKYNSLITSNVQLVRTLESLGAVIEDHTPTGQKSASKEQIEKLLVQGNPDVQELSKAVLQQRKAAKLANTYFKNFMEQSHNGFLHPSINTMAARTSRMSITNPALQTLPKGDDLVRRAFIPKDEDHVIITSDLDQVEFRMFASMSGDANLINLFNRADAEGSDPFTEIGRQVYEDPTMQKADKRRGLIKGCVPLSSQILTKRGWLNHDEITESDETIGYDFATGKNRWTKILGVHVYEDAEIYKLSNGHKSFLCTEDHRWVADNGRVGSRATEPKIIYANEFLTGENRIILSAPAEDGFLDISDREAYLLGWILGDGSIKRSEDVGGPSQSFGSRVGCKVKIFQTKKTGIALIEGAVINVPHTRWINEKTKQNVWTIDADYARELLSRAGIDDKKTFIPWDLASGLTLTARQKMIRGLDEADGKNKTARGTRTKIDVSIVQASDSPVTELVVALGYLTGKYSKQDMYLPVEGSTNWQKNPITVVQYQKETMTNQRASLDYVTNDYVWCVTTELGTWTMRQDEKIPVLTGNTVYGRLYGAGVAKQAETAGVLKEQMQAVSDSFDENYPGMARFQRKVSDVGEDRLKNEGQGYVNTWTGRRVPCDDDRTYSLVNYLIQGGAAEVFKSSLVRLDQADLTEFLIVPVHDEIVLQAPRGEAEEIKRIVQECMTTTEGWAVPLTAGVDGPLETWGDKY
jgi:DNA polymerase I-like protein with 3'-5' exonuclease and polymerase domains